MKIANFGMLVFVALTFSINLSQEVRAADGSAARSTYNYAPGTVKGDGANRDAYAGKLYVQGDSGSDVAGAANDTIWIKALTGRHGGGEVALPGTIRISGRVLTAEGIPIRNAVVTLWIGNPPFSAIQTYTGSMGTYVFEGLLLGLPYTLYPSAKRYRFPLLFPQIFPTEDFDHMDFTAMPQF
jgi:hypothetical protein